MVGVSTRIRNRAVRTLLKHYLRPKPRTDLKKLGSDYGGWVIPTTLLSHDSICYCVGVGEDITFDLELIARYGCQVFAFDPTPRAMRYMEDQTRNIYQFHFFALGLWSKDEKCKFFAPRNPNHVSHSIMNLQNTSTFFEAECKRLSSLMNQLGHQSLDLLKMDIEGAEHQVLQSLIEDRVQVRVICVEFDQPCPMSRILDTTRNLLRFGYSLVNIDSWNYTFVQNRCLG